ncbi:MAG: quinolinate synthase [Candidatus Omnitrophica bacterium 4484_70.1]|nr:MAG: quinolinate synthase [Candidatus Omnitrophica bacterium 4484_70.1]
MVNSIVEKISKLKKERKAVILAHNYQRPEVQEIADFIGDSLGLSIEASKTEAKVIVFCGVYFMAETAKILSPQKTVIIPDKDAGCPMADMITATELRKLKDKHPYAKVLCYVNTPAEVKAECDLCCTSANAIEIVNRQLKDAEEIIFAPDKYLAHYVSTQTKREFIYWDGYCPVHVGISSEDIKKKKEIYPSAEVIVHPECSSEVIKLADKVFSTEGMCKYAGSSDTEELIVGTEIDLLYRLRKENPQKSFYPASEEAVCSDMKLITLQKVLWALEEIEYEVTLPQEIIVRAQESIKRMVEQSE